MLQVTKPSMAIFVDRTNQRWIVRDTDGNFWIVPAQEAGWNQREPFEPNENVDLEPVPGHYKYLFSLPF